MPKKKSVSVNFIIPLVVYPFDVMVSVGQSDDQLGTVLDRFPLTENDILMCRYASDRARGRYCMFSTGGSFIRIRKLPETAGEFGTLSHEVFHVVATLLEHIGMELKVLVSDEAYAYLIGYLTEQIYKKLNKYYYLTPI